MRFTTMPDASLPRQTVLVSVCGCLAAWRSFTSARRRGILSSAARTKTSTWSGLPGKRGALQRLFIDHGYEPDREFNLLHGAQRLIFRHTADERHIDVFLDRFQMCHTFDLRDRLHLHSVTLPPTDLLLTKLQVVEATENDLRDLFALLSDLPLGAEPRRDRRCVHCTRGSARLGRLSDADTQSGTARTVVCRSSDIRRIPGIIADRSVARGYRAMPEDDGVENAGADRRPGALVRYSR